MESEARQKKAQSSAFAIAAGLCVLLSIGFVVSNLSVSEQSYKVDLENRINPNDASVASLVRLPGIGIGRASAIVAYRNKFAEQGSDKPVFQNPSDLQKVKGIGPKTVEKISEWLKFE